MSKPFTRTKIFDVHNQYGVFFPTKQLERTDEFKLSRINKQTWNPEDSFYRFSSFDFLAFTVLHAFSEEASYEDENCEKVTVYTDSSSFNQKHPYEPLSRGLDPNLYIRWISDTSFALGCKGKTQFAHNELTLIEGISL